MFSARQNPIGYARHRLIIVVVIVLVAGVTTKAFGEEGNTIEPLERILETARLFLADALKKDERTETHIEIGQLDSRLRLARCDPAPSAQLAPGARAEGNGAINVRCAKPVAWSIFVPFRVEHYTEAVVVARPLSRQQVIQPGDLRLERMESSKLTNGYFDEMPPVIGQQAKRALIPGQVLSSSHVVQRQLVERGQQVTLFSVRPGLTVRMKGEALEDGASGQRIRVRNQSSKRIVEGFVEPSGAIRVAF